MIYRSKRAENFTVLGNGIFADNGLSFEAMGLLAYLLSKPDNWAVHVQALVKATEGTAQQRGKNKIHALLNELIDAGYITRKRQSSGEMNYYVFDEPQVIENKPQPSNPAQANPAQANPAQDFEAVLINTEGQQELNKKKNGRETNARDAHAPPPATPVKSEVFNPLSALLALGVERQAAQDWLAVRKAKRAATTQTAIDGMKREAHKAGIALADAVRIAAERGWQGFRADWDWQSSGRSGGAPKGRVFDHTTGAEIGCATPTAAERAAARVERMKAKGLI